MPGSLWDLTSPTRDETCALSNGSTMSLPLDHQETPHHSALYYWLYFPFVSFRIFHELFIGCAGSKLLRGLLPSCASIVVASLVQRGLHGTWALVAAALGYWSTGSEVVAHGHSCLNAWELSDPGNVSPALTGRFLTTGPGKASFRFFQK